MKAKIIGTLLICIVAISCNGQYSDNKVVKKETPSTQNAEFFQGKKYYAEDELIDYVFVRSEETEIDSISVTLYKNRMSKNLVATLNKLIANDDMKQYEIIDVVDIHSIKDNIKINNVPRGQRTTLVLSNNGIILKEWSFRPSKNTSGSFGNDYDIGDYIDNDNYFIKTFDVNKDGIHDKIISSSRYKGDELLIFLGDKNNNFNFVLKSTNFSEDGGNQFSDINETKNGFEIITSFPDRGYFQKKYLITSNKNDFILLKIETETESWQDRYTEKCNQIVNFNLKRSTAKLFEKIAETKTDCTKIAEADLQ